MREPEKYNTSAVNAEMLRNLADEMEKKPIDQLQRISVQVWHATMDEVKDALRAKAQKLAKKYGVVAYVEFPDGTKEQVTP